MQMARRRYSNLLFSELVAVLEHRSFELIEGRLAPAYGLLDPPVNGTYNGVQL